MASIYKRPSKDGKSFTWRVAVRVKGFPAICKTFDRKQEAEDWGQDTERRIKSNQFNFDQHKQHNTFNDLLDRATNDGVLQHHRSIDDTMRHLKYWGERLGNYDLVHLDAALIGKERQFLLETPTIKGKKRSPASVNRTLSTLSTIMTYATKNLQWIEENPCSRIMKLKESPGRDRVLSEDEIIRLLAACRASSSPYLYCIVLIAITTGARQGEILNLEYRDIQFDNQLASIRETKNGRPRSIALSKEVVEEIKRLYVKRDSLKPLIFASKTVFGQVDIKKSWGTALKHTGITGCCFHTIRHSYATLAASIGASNLELSTAMGHRTLSQLQRYTHLDVAVTRKFSIHIAERILGRESEN